MLCGGMVHSPTAKVMFKKFLLGLPVQHGLVI